MAYKHNFWAKQEIKSVGPRTTFVEDTITISYDKWGIQTKEIIFFISYGDFQNNYKNTYLATLYPVMLVKCYGDQIFKGEYQCDSKFQI